MNGSGDCDYETTERLLPVYTTWGKLLNNTVKKQFFDVITSVGSGDIQEQS
jgi:hypothetical protein